DSITTSILAHEFQHLINASRRLYVTQGATDFEVVWLNEGLSHVAEELLFLHEAKLEPRRNVDVNVLRGSADVRTAYNADMAANVSRYRSYLVAPSESSPLRDDDSLETRGATWNFLRYAADRKAGTGGSDVATWQALVNSTTTGVANLRNVFGADVGGQLRDWSVSHYTDDLVAGNTPEHTQPSWNFHSIFPALTGSGNNYPLQVKALVAGAASGTLIGGSAAYYRFAIPANTTATISVSAATLIQSVVIRVR
ncbi:MAG: Peptidase hyicolysin, partial [Gemmatimonadetes bacterium]|nr:Peptidase hyicolysin [Gemmatimonadota bacterium]